MLLQISNKDLINFVYLKIYVSEVENIFDGTLARDLLSVGRLFAFLG